jgi:hypothetical protein
MTGLCIHKCRRKYCQKKKQKGKAKKGKGGKNNDPSEVEMEEKIKGPRYN